MSVTSVCLSASCGVTYFKLHKLFSLQVLQAWDDCTLDLTIETLVQKLQDWVRRGLVDSQVWQDIQELISYDLPFVTVFESCSAPISATIASTSNSTSLASKTLLKTNSNSLNCIYCMNRLIPIPLIDFFSPTGLKQLQLWTRDSFKMAPFCLTPINDWEPSDAQDLFPIRNACMKPKLLRRHIKAFGVEKTALTDLTEVLDNPQLPVNGPATLLLLGKACFEWSNLKEV